jgi:hypothetical protein
VYLRANDTTDYWATSVDTIFNPSGPNLPGGVFLPPLFILSFSVLLLPFFPLPFATFSPTSLPAAVYAFAFASFKYDVSTEYVDYTWPYMIGILGGAGSLAVTGHSLVTAIVEKCMGKKKKKEKKERDEDEEDEGEKEENEEKGKEMKNRKKKQDRKKEDGKEVQPLLSYNGLA